MWNPFKKAIETKSSSRVLGLSEELGSFLQFGSGNGNAATASGAMNLYRQSTAVSIPVNYIAEAFASINPVLKQGSEIITEHPVLELLRRPSPFFTQDLFLETLGKNYLVTGDCQVVAVGGLNRPPIELQPINPQNITINEGQGGLATNIIVSGETLTGSYLLEQKGNTVRYVRGNLSEIKQIRNYNTRNNSMLRGQSPLVAASVEVMQHINGNTHNVKLLENGGRVSLVFNYSGDTIMNDDDFEAVKTRVKSQFAGPGNAGTIGVTSGGNLEIQELGKTNKDMDYANLQGIAQRSVALQYKFPLPLLTVEASTMNNYRESKTALYDDAILPLADRIFGGLSDLLLPRYGLDPSKVRISYDLSQITALAGRRNEELKLRKELGVESTNEYRQLLGRPDDPNGNDIMVDANKVPLGTDMFSDPEPNTELARDTEL